MQTCAGSPCLGGRRWTLWQAAGLRAAGHCPQMILLIWPQAAHTSVADHSFCRPGSRAEVPGGGSSRTEPAAALPPPAGRRASRSWRGVACGIPIAIRTVDMAAVVGLGRGTWHRGTALRRDLKSTAWAQHSTNPSALKLLRSSIRDGAQPPAGPVCGTLCGRGGGDRQPSPHLQGCPALPVHQQVDVLQRRNCAAVPCRRVPAPLLSLPPPPPPAAPLSVVRCSPASGSILLA